MAYHLLFPGQGSQYVGMCRKVVSLPGVRELFARASEVLKYDLLKLCLEGPKCRLDDTVHCQPAVVVASLAAVEQLRVEKPEILEGCVGAAGFSVGEYTALIFAQVMTLEDGLHIIKARAEAMHEAGKLCSGTMATVIGLNEEQLQRLCIDAASHVPHGHETICIANYLFDRGHAISGSLQAVEYVKSTALQAGARTVKNLHVSGAFHSPLMAPATSKLQHVLSLYPLRAPLLPVYSNVTGVPYPNSSSVQELLVTQLQAPVKWETSIQHMIAKNPTAVFVECGPGRQLRAILGKLDKNAFKGCTNVEV